MDKKQIIINSARELFSRYGFKKVSMEEIAKKASVTKRTIYHYFKDKEALFSYFVKEELDKVKIILENNNNNNFSSRIVDDLKENIDAAIKVGMKGFVYHQNIQELEKYIENIL